MAFETWGEVSVSVRTSKKSNWSPFSWHNWYSRLLSIGFQGLIRLQLLHSNYDNIFQTTYVIYMQKKKFFLTSSIFFLFCSFTSLNFFFCHYSVSFHYCDTSSYRMQLTVSQCLLVSFTLLEMHFMENNTRKTNVQVHVWWFHMRSMFAWYMIAVECLQRRIHVKMKINDVEKHQYNSFQIPIDLLYIVLSFPYPLLYINTDSNPDLL